MAGTRKVHEGSQLTERIQGYLKMGSVNVEERETQTYDVRSSRGARRGALNREKFNLNTDRGSTSSTRSLR